MEEEEVPDDFPCAVGLCDPPNRVVMPQSGCDSCMEEVQNASSLPPEAALNDHVADIDRGFAEQWDAVVAGANFMNGGGDQNLDDAAQKQADLVEAPVPGIHYFCCFYTRRGRCRYGQTCSYAHNRHHELHLIQQNGIAIFCKRLARYGHCRHFEAGRHP